MDYYIDNIDEEAARMQRRKERNARMRLEKQRQMRRRRKMKLIMKRSVGILAFVLVMAISVTAFSKKPQDEFSVHTETEEKEDKKAWFIFGKDKKEEAVEQDAFTIEATMQSETADNEAVQEIEEPEVITLAEKGEDSYSFEATPSTTAIYNEEIISDYAILIDESTDTIVASKGAKERISPASMTKVLTILVAAENITEEQLDDTFIMTREITDYGYVNDCSSVGFLDGEEVTVRDLFYGTILHSGSDAAVGLATYVAGSHEAFVDMMNDKLEELGLGDTSHYTNCVGLYDKEHYSTVYDMAVIMKAAIQSEFCKEVLSEHRYVTESTTEHPEGIDISNWFLRRIEDKDTGGEVLCAKTGYVTQSKNCAVSYGTFAEGDPYICVTAGSTSSWRCIYDHVEIYNEYI